MKKYFLFTLFSLFLLLLSGWLISYGMDQRRIHYGNFGAQEKDAEVLAGFPVALYAFGDKAWSELDTEKAADFFRKAVALDPLFMDAWLNLAEVEIEGGNGVLARKITAFCHARTSQVLRWKQKQTLLAHELGMKDIFRHNLNYLVDRRRSLSDTFYLLDTHTHYKTEAALKLLTPGNRTTYLEWLMRWKRADAARTTWATIDADGRITDVLLLDYVDFLISQKDMVSATALWQQYTGQRGITNAGFEKKIMGDGFGWRIKRGKNEKNWQARRDFGRSHEGGHSLRVSFHGRENLKWHHIYQVVPVTPQQPHELTYWFKSKGITTDHGPFVEIYGYDAKGLYKKGPMATGSRDWTSAAVKFTPPPGCHAVVIRLRRNESLRFDNKIEGVYWVDGFTLQVHQKDGKMGEKV